MSLPPPQAKHKEQIDRLIARAHHHRKAMSDDKVTVEHLVLALGENQRWAGSGPSMGMQAWRQHGHMRAAWACIDTRAHAAYSSVS